MCVCVCVCVCVCSALLTQEIQNGKVLFSREMVGGLKSPCTHGTAPLCIKAILQVGILFFSFLGPHPRHMEVPRLGVKSEQLPAYTEATATSHLSCSCDLHRSSRKRQILNSAGPGIKPASSWILAGFVTMSHHGNSWVGSFKCVIRN